MTIAERGDRMGARGVSIRSGLRRGVNAAATALIFLLVVLLAGQSALAADDKKKEKGGGNFNERNLKKIQKMYELPGGG